MFGQRAMAVETRAKRNVEIDYKALYATVQSALDEKDDEIHRLQIELSKSKTRVDSLLNEIAKARSAQQAAEMQANALSAVQKSISDIAQTSNTPDKCLGGLQRKTRGVMKTKCMEVACF